MITVSNCKDFHKHFLYRSKEMIEVYRSVYRVRQQLLSIKVGLEVKVSAGTDADHQQSDSSDGEEDSASSQNDALGIF